MDREQLARKVCRAGIGSKYRMRAYRLIFRHRTYIAFISMTLWLILLFVETAGFQNKQEGFMKTND